MNPHYEKELEARIRRELDALGELSAPPALANRIMGVIAKRPAAPWYRQSWTAWPFGLRMASLAGLVLLFTGLCFAGWELMHGATGQWVGGRFADAGALWRTLGVLVDTAASLVRQLGNGVIMAGMALMFAAWVMCFGLGTVFVRLAMRPSMNRISI